MDPDSSFRHKSFETSITLPDRGWNYYRKKPMFLTYGLMALSYILILALFIIVLSKSSSGGPKVNTNIQAEISALKKNISDLTSKCNTLEQTSAKASCEKNWIQFDGSCYYIHLRKSTWMNARSVCKTKGSDLVVITSEEEQHFLMINTNGKDQRFWIGLHDMDDEGTWTWVDGTDYEKSYKFWMKGQPNDYKLNEDCAHLWRNGEWNDSHCTDDCYAICEKKRG
ncbi:hepatic lectin-like isoform X2 [Spea bombifrons]|uniref:hepatic lectin-like isoform X2 n=1 Tax=Spea bombifrons TaxID=233779 RepID=UPI0023491283|nr:hepatic lectin-like isoform X2 [Spea bombifrons]